MQRDGTLDCNVRNEDSLAPPGTREWFRGRIAVDTYEVLLRILFWVMAESEDSVRERLRDAMVLNGGSVLFCDFSIIFGDQKVVHIYICYTALQLPARCAA